MTDFFRFRLFNYLPSSLVDENNVIRVRMKELTFEELFIECFFPIWKYGKEDRYKQDVLLQMTQQLLQCDVTQKNNDLLQNFKAKIMLQMSLREI